MKRRTKRRKKQSKLMKYTGKRFRRTRIRNKIRPEKKMKVKRRKTNTKPDKLLMKED